jgi:hypothetical protein
VGPAPAHPRCQLRRTFTRSDRPMRTAQGRPLGMLAAWCRGVSLARNAARDDHQRYIPSLLVRQAARAQLEGELAAEVRGGVLRPRATEEIGRASRASGRAVAYSYSALPKGLLFTPTRPSHSIDVLRCIRRHTDSAVDQSELRQNEQGVPHRALW